MNPHTPFFHPCDPSLPPPLLPSPLPQEVLLTAVDLLKLEKVEFGGVRGRSLSQPVQWLHQDFLDTYKVFTEKPYDCLDVTNKVALKDTQELTS